MPNDNRFVYMTAGNGDLVFIKYNKKYGYKGYSQKEMTSEFRKYRAYAESTYFDRASIDDLDIYIHVDVPEDKFNKILKSPWIFDSTVDKNKLAAKNRLLGIKVGDINVIQNSMKEKYNLYTYRDIFLMHDDIYTLWVFNPYMDEINADGIYEGFLSARHDGVNDVRQISGKYFYFTPNSFIFSTLDHWLMYLKRKAMKCITGAIDYDKLAYSFNVTKEYIACRVKSCSVDGVSVIYYENLNEVVTKGVRDGIMKQRGIKFTLLRDSILFLKG